MTSTWIRGGRVFDGRGDEGREADVWIRDGRVAAIEAPRTEPPAGAEVFDADGCWVTPGFVDLHTHYDAEVEVLPGLSESVRHGVTTVVMGSCGLSMVMGEPEDLADMFCRVEGIPRDVVLPILEREKTWDGPRAYLAHLAERALGPNVACLLGHSTIRAAAMGLRRSLEKGEAPTEAELARMEGWLEEALDAGYLGLSINTLTWDKMDAGPDRPDLRSRPTPSTFASWREYRRFTRILRERGRVFQGVPNVSTKVNVLLFFLESLGVGRRGLKTMIISMMDAKAARMPFRLVGFLSNLVNRHLGADIRFQSLPNVFDLWVEGMEAPVFEELGAGTEALGEPDSERRAALLRDPKFRKRFARDWGDVLFGRAFHRDLADTEILECPDASLVGRSFGAIAKERGQKPLELFLDLVAAHGDALRWYTVVGNDRPEWVRWIASHPAVLVGFSDAGAHLRNMAHYNFPLRLLRQVKETGFMPVGRAIHRVTGEIADWLDLDVGRLEPGARADVVVIDPAGLTEEVDRIHEAPIEGFGDLKRLVRRNDDAVRGVWIGGRLAVRDGRPLEVLGTERLGAVLRAGEPVEVAAPVAEAAE
ncbi:MAG TPA: amidohydrolase family protein [Sandaracinaceae bacterium LLY-WYZ-13_1]|nr:amidohydrolase family protein [Sandaracinaceae bacterium LLY-WYZ-13_1]